MKVQKVDLEISGVIVIQSLPDNEPQTGRLLYDDIIKRLCHYRNMHSGIIDVKSKEQFQTLAASLADAYETNRLLPLLHFEIHGNEQGLVLSNKELVTWAEVGTFTRSINILLRNKLFITLATCKGAFILKSIASSSMLAPFWGMVGPKDVIYHYELVEDFSAFYAELLTNFDLQQAIDTLNSSNLRTPYILMTAEAIFENFIEDYFEGKPLDKQDKFQQLSSKMKELYPDLTTPERNKLLQRKIDGFNRPLFIKQLKDLFLMKGVG